ncbi:MAG TPA: hypothetical protein VMV29_08180 [Ktedonobacterales bacterium]|nr:hypothetical protein [Ktedonobacterales bacterium]
MIEQKHEKQQTEPTVQEASRVLREQIAHELGALSPFYLEKTLAYIRSFPQLPQGIPGQELVDLFQRFHISPEEAAQMDQILEEIERQG